MNTSIVLFILILLCFRKLLLLIIIYPFASLEQYRLLFVDKNTSHVNKCKYQIIKILCIPYYVVEYKLFRGGIMRYLIYKIGLLPSCHLRRIMYRGLGTQIGKNVVFHFRTEIRAPHKLSIGYGSIIGDNAILDARCGLKVGNNVNLSSNVSIYTLQHDYQNPYFNCTQRHNMNVIIDDRAWISSNVIILPGVHIGEGAVCCAGSVVTKNIEPYSVVAGIPAKKISERPRNLKYNFDGKSCRLY